MTATTRGWLGDVALAALFTGLAWALRHWGGYPMCPGDEASWLQIAGELDRGRAWPVSGPGYMAAVQALAHRLEQPTAAAIPLWGMASVLGVVLTLLRVYRQLGPMPPWLVCTGLALSSYFLAPLFESRPQQWGQALVLLGAWLCWRWLHASKGAWAFCAVLALTAVLHILSHAVLVHCAADWRRHAGASSRSLASPCRHVVGAAAQPGRLPLAGWALRPHAA